MRATISFDADVSKVNDIMRCLVLEESNTLQDALICIEKATEDRLTEGISQALGHIQEASRQLEQYRDMVLSFEKARFETILPQPATAVFPLPDSEPPLGELVKNLRQAQSALKNADKFQDFLSRIGEEGESDDTEQG